METLLKLMFFESMSVFVIFLQYGPDKDLSKIMEFSPDEIIIRRHTYYIRDCRPYSVVSSCVHEIC